LILIAKLIQERNNELTRKTWHCILPTHTIIDNLVIIITIYTIHILINNNLIYYMYNKYKCEKLKKKMKN